MADKRGTCWFTNRPHTKDYCFDNHSSNQTWEPLADAQPAKQCETDFCVCDYRPRRKCSVHPDAQPAKTPQVDGHTLCRCGHTRNDHGRRPGGQNDCDFCNCDKFKAGEVSVEAKPATKFYVASRASLPERPAMWKKLRSAGLQITSSWIDEAGPGETDSLSELWLRIMREIAAADCLILYAESGDFPLKGALVEVGIALGMGKQIRIVLPGVKLEGRTFRPVGSWIEHPNVKLCTMQEAIAPVSSAAQVATGQWDKCESCGEIESHPGHSQEWCFGGIVGAHQFKRAEVVIPEADAPEIKLGRLGAYLNTMVAELRIEGKGEYLRQLFNNYLLEESAAAESRLTAQQDTPPTEQCLSCGGTREQPKDGKHCWSIFHAQTGNKALQDIAMDATKRRQAAERDLERTEQALSEARRTIAKLKRDLQFLVDEDPDCSCDDHTSDDCCAAVDVFCARCLSAWALAGDESKP